MKVGKKGGVGIRRPITSNNNVCTARKGQFNAKYLVRGTNMDGDVSNSDFERTRTPPPLLPDLSSL